MLLTSHLGKAILHGRERQQTRWVYEWRIRQHGPCEHCFCSTDRLLHRSC